QPAAAFVRLMRVADGNGATVAGLPLITGPGVTGITLVASDRIALSLGDRIVFDASAEGNVEMTTDPENESGSIISLFQANARALRGVASINLSVVAPSDTSGSGAVVSVTNAAYA